jgi:glutamate/tyrosine decarboxylase-like PLP-dependent enzyme
MMSFLDPSMEEQRVVLDTAVRFAVARAEEAGDIDVSPRLDAGELRRRLGELDPEVPMDAIAAIEWCTGLMDESMVHTTSPSYYGLFNPSPSFMGVVGDLLTAVYNPQLAVWSHAPGPVEIVGGSFTSGGAEANAMAVHVALTHTFPDFGSKGLRGVDGDPVVYISTESHHAWVKIAHACGIGRDSIRHIPVTADLKLDTALLRDQITRDEAAGNRPTLVVATAGTTSAGIIDDLHEVRSIATNHDIFFHVDAAWGGSAVLSDALRPHLDGIETADSVTIDAHKWMSVPMGAGIFFTPHDELLNETYRISTAYMPDAVADTTDPYTTTNQWSRRFMGLKLLLTLLTAGRTGYQQQLDHDTELGDYLRQRLLHNGWDTINDTPLPVVCFIDPAFPQDMPHHQRIVDQVLDTGQAWISTTIVNGRPTIRACITSHRTTHQDIDTLVELLQEART